MSLQNVVMMLRSDSTDSSETSNSSHLNFSYFSLRSSPEVTSILWHMFLFWVFTSIHPWKHLLRRGVWKTERVELPEIHLCSPETDPFFFPWALVVKGRGHCHENGLDFAGTGLSGNCYVRWSNDFIVPNTGLLALTTTFHSYLLSSAA